MNASAPGGPLVNPAMSPAEAVDRLCAGDADRVVWLNAVDELRGHRFKRAPGGRGRGLHRPCHVHLHPLGTPPLGSMSR
eukprot:82381-Chlamydomonas_euryale.AAC.6